MPSRIFAQEQTPPWVTELVAVWCERLMLTPWFVRIKLALCLGNNPNTTGLCETWPNVNTAHLTLRADVTETSEWRETIVHETLHIAHARIDQFIEDVLIPRLPDQTARDICRQGYCDLVEAYTDLMAVALNDLDRRATPTVMTDKEEECDEGQERSKPGIGFRPPDRPNEPAGTASGDLY